MIDEASWPGGEADRGFETPLGTRLGLQPLHWDDWMLAAIVAIATAIITPAPRGR